MRTTSVLPRAQETLRAVERRGRAGAVSPASWADIPGIREHFVDEDRLLATLQQRWLHTLAAEVEDVLEMGEGELREDVRSAYRKAVSRHPGLRRILDAHGDHPSVAAGRRSEHELLCRAAGVHSIGQLECGADEAPAVPRRPGRIERLARLIRPRLRATGGAPRGRTRLGGSLPL